jgi:hypothetical protein
MTISTISTILHLTRCISFYCVIILKWQIANFAKYKNNIAKCKPLLLLQFVGIVNFANIIIK